MDEPKPSTSRGALKRSRNESGDGLSAIIKEELSGSASPSMLYDGNGEDLEPEVPNMYNGNGEDLEPEVPDMEPVEKKPSPLDIENENKKTKANIRPSSPKLPVEPSFDAPLLNFFKFEDSTVPQPKINSLNYKAGDVGAPPPKMPKKAHYNCHNQQEEKQYISDNAAQAEKAIVDHKNDSDGSEDESKFEPHRKRYFKKHNVYTMFDFSYRKIDTSRLEVCAKKDIILEAIESNRVVIIEGFTGCGKTTQIPQFILDKCAAASRLCSIVVTQPRRIAAVSVAKRVCVERGWDVGSVVGYQVGMEKRSEKDTTLLTYMTTGVLLQKLIGAKTLKDYTHIIIDEVHERDLESDLLLLVIKKILQDDQEGKEKHVKIILMSATLNAQKFSEYFLSKRDEYGDIEQSPIIKIPTNFRHRVVEKFLDDLVDSEKLDAIAHNLDTDKATMLDDVYDTAVTLITQFDEMEANSFAKDPRRKDKQSAFVEKRGSVLIFLPGMEEINYLFKLLNAKNKERVAETREPDEYKWDICPLHSSVTIEDQAKVFEIPQKFRRKIILSTNIAESSVTVPDVVYVIDFCMTKSMCVDIRTNFTTLRLVWASISQCIQRKGRTGRVADGKVYRLVPRSFYLKLENHSKPEMLRSNLETVILQLKKLNLGSPKELLSLALDPPIVSGIERAVANLKEYGALTLTLRVTDENQTKQSYDTCDGDRTFLGRVMTELPIPQQCSRLIMLGHCFGVLKEAIIIAAALSVKNPFSTPFQKQLAAYLTKMNWSKKSYSDCFCLLYVYKNWTTKFGDTGDSRQQHRARENERRWARGEYIQLSVLREIKGTVELIEDRLKHNLHIIPQPLVFEDNANLTKEQSLMLKVAIAGAFYPNYFHRHRPDMKTYEKERSKDVSGHDLFNTVVLKGFPPRHDGKLYAKHVADYLSFGLTIPIIKFEGQKVLAVFDNRGDKIGPINKGLYRAVKKRQIREFCEFDMVWVDKEAEELRAWQRNQDRRQCTKAPKQVELPPINITSLEVFITHMLSPSHFWIVYMRRYEFLNSMVAAINNELCHIPLPKRKVVPNAFCLAPHKDDALYYRGKILLVDPTGEALIYFVDYGNSAWTKMSVLMDFSPSMCEKGFNTYPALAVECRMAKMKPATVHGPVWHEDAIKRFHDYTQDKCLVVDIYSVHNSVICGTITASTPNNAQNGAEPISINEYLRTEGFADEMPETYLSELNHSVRNRAELIVGNQAEFEAHNKDQMAEYYDLDFIDPPKRGTVRASLKGPWSPLELEFQNLCSSSSSKQVTIDNNSVNSVVLDYEPTAPTSRLLVAAHVAIQDRSGKLVARDTTMMPALPGLIALMSMIFAPAIELRTDMRKTRYTGVLCGLGTSPNEPDLPIYPDHDLEIVFDTIIDPDDIVKINNIRYLINVILRPDGGRVNISHSHKALVRELFSLLKKDRKRADEEIWPQEEYVWNKLDPDSTKLPSKQAFDYKHLDIFVPHKTVKLIEDSEDDMSWGWDV